MTVEFFLAPAGGGKTAYAIERIRALPPLAGVRVITPNRSQATAFRHRLAQAGGALGCEVQTFYDLYADLLATTASSSAATHLPRLPSAVRHRLIQHLVERLAADGQLVYYAPLRNTPGFARLLAALFEEFKRARVYPDRLLAATVACAPQMTELARLYTAYQDWLLDKGWVDAEGQGWLAALALEHDPTLQRGLVLLIVDGFDEFNPTQLHVLRLLADRAQQTLVTLSGDAARPDRLAHRRLARARRALTEALVPCSPVARPLPSSSPALAHLEHHLFESGAPHHPAGETIEFVEAHNRATEAREALRWLKARLLRDGIALSEAAIVARDVTPYRPFLQEVAAEFGLPLRLSDGSPLDGNPAIAALLNLLALPHPPLDWAPRALLDALTSPYFDWTACGVQPGDAQRLDDVARLGRVVNGLAQWRQALQRLDAAVDDEALPGADEDEFAPRRPPNSRQAARLAALLETLAARLAPPATATLHEQIAWLEELIGADEDETSDDDSSLRLVARARENAASAERDVAALRALKDVLRGLVLAESLLDSPPPPLFPTGLPQAIEGVTYTEPLHGAALLAASVLDVRGLSFDSVALLGLAEGDFPRAEREDALLGEAERAWLADQGFAIEQRLQGDEATLFYHAVTRTRRRLLLCRPYLADDGQPWEPSPYWIAVRQILDCASPHCARPGDPLADVASNQELEYVQPGPAAQTAALVLQARECSAPSPWRGDLSEHAEQLAEQFGAAHTWSSSRLETYARCGFCFWATYVMELEPRELAEAGFDVLTLGSIYHLVLERLYDRVPDGDPERLRAVLPAVAADVYASAPNDYGFRPTPLWERQQEELTTDLRRTVEALIDVSAGYRPLASEWAFGLRDRPPLVLHGAGAPLHMRGYIDRVDQAADGHIRIIDYKAGSSTISPRDLTEGRRLQLPLYALAAQEAFGCEVASAFYWHIRAARPSSLKLENVDGGVAAAIETAVSYARQIADAVRAGQFPPHRPGNGCPGSCPAAAFCELYQASR